MYSKIIVLALVACTALAVPVEYSPYAAGPAYGHHEVYPDSHPKYEFKYGVEDPHTGDHKSQSEARDGDVVHGEYSLIQPDGTVRKVQYSADDHNGFNAAVSYSGHATHPQEVKKVYAAAPAYYH